MGGQTAAAGGGRELESGGKKGERARSGETYVVESLLAGVAVDDGRRVEVQVGGDDVGGVGDAGYAAARRRVEVVAARVLGDGGRDARGAAISAAWRVGRVRRVGHLREKETHVHTVLEGPAADALPTRPIIIFRLFSPRRAAPAPRHNSMIFLMNLVATPHALLAGGFLRRFPAHSPFGGS